MWYILIDVLLSTAGALMWCLLVTFCCMCIEHLLFKKQDRPRLTDKEVILIKEVLAGHISLPLVANDGLFVECVDRIEHIFERFITKSRQQAEQLENLCEKIPAIQTDNNPVDFSYPLLNGDPYPPVDKKIEELLCHVETGGKKEKIDKLLKAQMHIIGLPNGSRYILKKGMNCKNVGDVLHLMLHASSRESLLKIYGIGKISVDRLEAFMFGNGLIYLQGYAYKSGYEDPERLNELNEL
jgi:hypothetical protein